MDIIGFLGYLQFPKLGEVFSLVRPAVLEFHRGLFLSSALQKLYWVQKVVPQQTASSVLMCSSVFDFLVLYKYQVLAKSVWREAVSIRVFF